MGLTGLGPLDIQEVVAPVKAKPKRDGRICVCGHGAKNHAATVSAHFDTPLEEIPQGMIGCSAGRHQCACEQFYAVLETSDTRRFMSKTVGPGMDHALARGVNTALSAGVEIHWREGLACGKCGAANVPLLPVGIRIGPNGPEMARESAKYNYLLCSSCREELPTQVDPDKLKTVSAPEPKF